MNKFFKALAIGITTSIMFCVVFIAFFYFFMNLKEMINVDLVVELASIIFFSVFFSVWFYKKKGFHRFGFLKYLIKVLIFSVLSDLLVTIIKTYRSGFFNFYPSINQVFFTLFIAAVSSFVMYASKKKVKVIAYKIDNLLYSWLFITVILSSFIILNSGSSYYYLLLAFLGLVYIWLLYVTNKEGRQKYSKYIYYSFIVLSFLIYVFLWGAILDKLSLHKRLLEIIFLGIYFLLILVVNYFIVVYKKNKKEEEKESKELQENYKKLKQRLSPDYLFQNLNYLSNIIEEAPFKSIQFSENLSEVYRYFLKNEKEDIVKLKEEVGFIESYVGIYKAKTNYRLVFEIEIKEKYMESYIVSGVVYTILKQLENAPKKEVNYRFSVIEEQLTVEIDSILELDNEIEFIKNKYSYFTEECVQFFNSNNKTLIKLPILSEY